MMMTILGDTRYEVPMPYSVEPFKHKNTVKSRKLKKTQNLPPVLCKTKDQLDDYMKHCVDGRKTRLSNTVKQYHDLCSGEAVRNNTPNFMKKPQYDAMRAIVPLIRYQNIVLVTYDEMAKALGCHKNAINGKMKMVSDFVRREEDGLKRGMIKLYVHPLLGYKYDVNYLDMKKEQALRDWYSA